ncbi:MAG: DUF5677 domain-containing protein [candidate division KSB1 bacterium]|nr:DUF5677 domain-containing protein [candidate division KSB1 bacterium]
MTDDQESPLDEFIGSYCSNVVEGLESRWNAHTLEIYKNEISEAIWGLTSRQATLGLEMARNPGIWNPHVAPIILRAMIDVHITLAWIINDPEDRSRDYIRFGLGQGKLYLEYLQNEADQIPEGELDQPLEDIIEMRKSWLNSQLMEWAIEVNVGSWSGKSTREMAQESGCESLYKFAYVPFSGPAHSMWQHVGIYNVAPCQNPLHKNHRMPVLTDFDFLYRSAKYESRTYELLSDKLQLNVAVPLPVDFFFENHPFKGRENEADG